MPKQIWRHPAVEQDLLDIWVYVARDNVKAADKLTDAILRRLDDLLQFPEMGAKRRDIGLGVRSLLVGDYVILYRIRNDRVEIARIAHGRRNLSVMS